MLTEDYVSCTADSTEVVDRVSAKESLHPTEDLKRIY